MSVESRNDIRLALPSKGRLSEETLDLLSRAGLAVYKPNPRQYLASIPGLPGVTVLFQRAGDIAASVYAGTVDFGITGWDVVAEKGGTHGTVLNLLPDLGYGFCALHVIVPESWEGIRQMADLRRKQAELDRPLRAAAKFTRLAGDFFARHDLANVQLISAEGTLEIAPTIGHTDLIVDLVSSGTTLRDNRLRPLEDGQILQSQACLIANQAALKRRPEVLAVARQMIDFIVAHLRAQHNVAVFANMRGGSPQEIAAKMLPKAVIGGLQGPTISQVITSQGGDWYAVNIVVRRDQLAQAIGELRSVGGSGVVVTPVTYIFEEEPAAYTEMLAALKSGESGLGELSQAKPCLPDVL